MAGRHRSLARWEAMARGELDGFLYARNTPSDGVTKLEESIAGLENAECGVAFTTGMAAISAVALTFLRPGKKVVVSDATYGGATHLFGTILPAWGVEVTMVSSTDESALRDAIKRGCDLLYLESPSNPLLSIQDIQTLSGWAHDVDAMVAIDNTVATPVNQQPLGLGADLVIHSATKFLGGHADAMGGLVACTHSCAAQLRAHRDIYGACLDPMSAFLLSRGLRTLELRMERHNQNAVALAAYLEEHPAVRSVYHPSLPSNHGHELAKAQMSGFGALLSFELEADVRMVPATLERFELAQLASTLGSVDTLLGTPSTTSHVECSAQERAALGIPEGLVRCSVGIEPVECILQDFDQALGG